MTEEKKITISMGQEEIKRFAFRLLKECAHSKGQENIEVTIVADHCDGNESDLFLTINNANMESDKIPTDCRIWEEVTT